MKQKLFIPRELIYEIVSFLNFKELINFTLISKSINTILYENNQIMNDIWKTLCNTYWVLKYEEKIVIEKENYYQTFKNRLIEFNNWKSGLNVSSIKDYLLLLWWYFIFLKINRVFIDPKKQPW
jgi:hypothetical protein